MNLWELECDILGWPATPTRVYRVPPPLRDVEPREPSGYPSEAGIDCARRMRLGRLRAKEAA